MHLSHDSIAYICYQRFLHNPVAQGKKVHGEITLTCFAIFFSKFNQHWEISNTHEPHIDCFLSLPISLVLAFLGLQVQGHLFVFLSHRFNLIFTALEFWRNRSISENWYPCVNVKWRLYWMLIFHQWLDWVGITDDMLTGSSEHHHGHWESS